MDNKRQLKRTGALAPPGGANYGEQPAAGIFEPAPVGWLAGQQLKGLP